MKASAMHQWVSTMISFAVLMVSGAATLAQTPTAPTPVQRRDEAITTIVRSCSDEIAATVKSAERQNPEYTKAKIVEELLGVIVQQYDSPTMADEKDFHSTLGSASALKPGSVEEYRAHKAMLRWCVQRQRARLEDDPARRVEPGITMFWRSHEFPGAARSSPDSERLTQCVEVGRNYSLVPMLTNTCDEAIWVNWCIAEFECSRFAFGGPLRKSQSTSIDTLRRGPANTIIYWACPPMHRAAHNWRTKEFGCRKVG